MGDTEKPVAFILGDSGEEASNDPRWLAQKMKEQIEAQSVATDTLAGAADKSLEKMSVDELKSKVKELEAEGISVDTKGVKKKSELVARIQVAMAEANDEDVDDEDEES